MRIGVGQIQFAPIDGGELAVVDQRLQRLPQCPGRRDALVVAEQQHEAILEAASQFTVRLLDQRRLPIGGQQRGEVGIGG